MSSVKKHPDSLSPSDQKLWEMVKQEVRPLPSKAFLTSNLPLQTPSGKSLKSIGSKRVTKAHLPVWNPPQTFIATESRPQTSPSAYQPNDLRNGGSLGLDGAGARRLRRGKMPIEGVLDLHGFTQAQAQPELESFIIEAGRTGKRFLLIITGKGRGSNGDGILRKRVPEWLRQGRLEKLVLAFSYAKKHDGDQGALYILLRRSTK